METDVELIRTPAHALLYGHAFVLLALSEFAFSHVTWQKKTMQAIFSEVVLWSRKKTISIFRVELHYWSHLLQSDLTVISQKVNVKIIEIGSPFPCVCVWYMQKYA